MSAPPRQYVNYWSAMHAGHDSAPRPPERIVAENGEPAWLLTRAADVRAVLSDPRFSADPSRTGYPVGPGHRGASTSGSMIRSDGDEHHRIRRMFTGEFSLERITRSRPLIEASARLAVHDLLQAGPPRDFIQAVALPVPHRVVMHLIGIDAGNKETFVEAARHLHDRGFPHGCLDSAEHGFHQLLRALIDEHRKRPRDDLVGRLLTNQIDLGLLSEEEAVLNLRLIVAASLQTTSSMIGLSVLSLLQQRASDRVLMLEHLPVTVEFLLSSWSVVQTGPRRVALSDVEVGGCAIRRGDGVIISLPAANKELRDLAVGIESPSSVGEGRGNPRNHVAFGFGVHQCLGQNLARAELEAVLRLTFEQIPEMQLAVDELHLEFHTDSVIFGLRELPVVW